MILQSKKNNGSSVSAGEPSMKGDTLLMSKKNKPIKAGNPVQKAKIENKKHSLQIDKNMADALPYIRVYQEEGLIEVTPGFFTRSYQLSDIKKEDVADEDISLYLVKMQELINSFDIKTTIQFTAFNKTSNEDGMENILLKDNKNPDIALYNNVIRENAKIANNNIEQTHYFTLGITEDTADEAVEIAKVFDKHVLTAFENIYHIKAAPMDITDRLHTLYDMYNPGVEKFGYIAGLKENESVDFDNLRRLHLTSKDLIAPQKLDKSVKLKNHFILNNNTYVRTFFINTLPLKVAQFFLTDITNLFDNMIYTVTMQPFDAKYGFDTAKELVLKNTDTKIIKVRDTLEDKRNKTTKQVDTMIEQSEQAFFNQVALDVCTKATALKQNIFGCSAVITVYADSLDILNSYTDLLRVSASKYAIQIKSLDVQQYNGFCSALPLAKTKVDIKRVFNADRAAALVPIDFSHICSQGGQYYGINAFTDGLVLINRNNYKNKSGLIAGGKKSGKTYQAKREIFNTYISSEEQIVVITNTSDYEDFAKRLGGTVIEGKFNPFHNEQGYNLMNDGYVLKKQYLKGLLNLAFQRTEEYAWEKRRNDSFKTMIEKNDALVDKFLSSYLEADLSTINEAIKQYTPQVQTAFHVAETQIPSNKLVVISVENDIDLLKSIEAVWIYAIRQKKQNRNVNLYIDSVDSLLFYPEAKDFVVNVLENMTTLQNINTIVLQDSAAIAASHNYMFDEFVKKIGYAKLLNSGIKERQYFESLLNIPSILMQYISVAEKGKLGAGLIVSNTSNIAFDDNYVNAQGVLAEFHKIFEKKIEQNTISYSKLKK